MAADLERVVGILPIGNAVGSVDGHIDAGIREAAPHMPIAEWRQRLRGNARRGKRKMVVPVGHRRIRVLGTSQEVHVDGLRTGAMLNLGEPGIAKRRDETQRNLGVDRLRQQEQHRHHHRDTKGRQRRTLFPATPQKTDSGKGNDGGLGKARDCPAEHRKKHRTGRPFANIELSPIARPHKHEQQGLHHDVVVDREKRGSPGDEHPNPESGIFRSPKSRAAR